MRTFKKFLCCAAFVNELPRNLHFQRLCIIQKTKYFFVRNIVCDSYRILAEIEILEL